MNNFKFSRKSNNFDRNNFSTSQSLSNFGQTTNNFLNAQPGTLNTAQNYYPEILEVPENHVPQKDEPFDISDLSQFQQDFSYLQNSSNPKATNQENFSQNTEKTQKNAEKFENSAENFDFSKENNENLNFENQNPSLSSKNDNFFTQKFKEENQNQKNWQKNGINFENIMNFLKNGSQTDLLSSMLASGVFKNQNPVMVETLSKMLSQKNSVAPKKHSPAPDTDFFEEM